VAADPVLAARLAEFEAVARQVARPVEPVAEDTRERTIARAVLAADTGDVGTGDVVAIDRGRSRPGPNRTVLVAAAAVIVLLALAGGLLAVDDGDDAADQATVADGEAGTETAGDITMPDLDLGPVADPETLRALITEATGLAGDGTTEAFTTSDDAAGADAAEPAPQGITPSPPAAEESELRSGEDCTIELVENRPELIGQLAEGTVTYQGVAAYVFVYNDADLGGAVGIVTSTVDCTVLAEVTL
jgi:hypothetical protein